MTAIVVLKSAAADFREIRDSFRERRGDEAYRKFVAAFPQLFERMKQYPESGVPVEEAREVGLDIRQHLCEQVRVIHSYDKAADVIHIRMFVPTKRNFLEHLTNRVLRP